MESPVDSEPRKRRAQQNELGDLTLVLQSFVTDLTKLSNSQIPAEDRAVELLLDQFKEKEYIWKIEASEVLQSSIYARLFLAAAKEDREGLLESFLARSRTL
jgi:hypothetical protein